MIRVDFEESLNEILDEKSDKNTKLLLEILDKKSVIKQRDFLAEFEKSVLMTNKPKSQKLSFDIIKDEKDLANDEDMLITDMVKDSKNITENETDKINNNVDEKELENDKDVSSEISEEELDQKYSEDLSLKEKKFAYIYEKAMEEYYRLKMSIERQNLKEGSLSYDDRNFEKLMRLKDVAVKAESKFRMSTKGKYIGETIESIGQLESKNDIELAKYQKENNRMHEKANENVQNVKEQIDECLENINSLAESISQNPDSQDLSSKLESEHNKYVKLNKKLETMVPNTVALAIEEKRSIKQDSIENREFGYVDKKKTRYSSNVNAKDLNYIKKQEAIEEKVDESGTLSSLQGVEQSVEDSRKKMFEKIDDAIQNKDFKTAMELLDTYSSMYGQDIVDDDSSVKKDIDKLNEKISEHMGKQDLSEKVKEEDEYIPDLSTQEGVFKNSLRASVYSKVEIANNTSKESLTQIENIVSGKSNSSKYEIERTTVNNISSAS